MALKSDIYGLNINPSSGGLTATAAATTITIATALSAILNGFFVALATGAKALALVNNNGVAVTNFPFLTAPILLSGIYTSTNGLVTSYGQGAIMVNCLAYMLGGVAVAPRTSGATITLVSVVGPTVNYDFNGSIIGTVTSVGGNASPGELTFPDIPDYLVPVNYFTVKNLPATATTASATPLFTFGTTNWNATNITTASYDISTLPLRPLLTA